MPALVKKVKQLQSYSEEQLEEIMTNYDNALILKEAEQAIRSP